MELKYSVNQVVNRYAIIPGCFVPYVEHRQSSFRMMLMGPWVFRMAMSTGFNFKSPAALAPNKKVSLFFEAEARH